LLCQFLGSYYTLYLAVVLGPSMPLNPAQIHAYEKCNVNVDFEVLVQQNYQLQFFSIAFDHFSDQNKNSTQ